MRIIIEVNTFEQLLRQSWGQALDFLKEVAEHNKCKELMELLENFFDYDIEEVQLNDVLSYDNDFIREALGLPTD